MADIKQIKEKELEKVSGGNVSNNPKGLIEGSTVYFYYSGIWLYGIFEKYDDGLYLVSWKETKIIANGVLLGVMAAGHDLIKGEDIA